jgi:hypothetical protein
MYCEFIAERGQQAAGPIRVARWHVVRQDQHTALCGRVLARGAETQSLAGHRARSRGAVCAACWTSFRALP